jgi:hypothetical protein
VVVSTQGKGDKAALKNDHRPAYWRQRALRQQERLRIDFREISGFFDFRLLQQNLPNGDLIHTTASEANRTPVGRGNSFFVGIVTFDDPADADVGPVQDDLDRQDAGGWANLIAGSQTGLAVTFPARKFIVPISRPGPV